MSTGTQVRKSSIKKFRKRRRADGKDYISNLPECVITHILSCLPIEDAVQTCVLSKEWKYKWTSIYNINIDDQVPYSYRYKEIAFANFVDRILLLLQNVKKFHLNCRERYKSIRVRSWISAVLKRNVETFEVYYPFAAGIVDLPRSLLNNTSLRRLRLVLPSIFKVSFRNCFPNLTSLVLYGVEIQNELSNTDTLIFSFPVLETFDLSQCKWINVKFVEFHAPVLKTFKSEIPDDARVDDYSMKIFGARLARFESSGGFPENWILTGSSVVSATLLNEEGGLVNLHLLGKHGLNVRKLLKGFTSLEYLALSGWIAEALAASKQGLALPKFNNLDTLILSDHTYTDESEVILELLHATPFVKYLSINVNILRGFEYNAVESVPSCIVSHLKKVYFAAFEGATPMIAFAMFLMKYAVKLENIDIRGNFDDGDYWVYDRMPKNELLELLSTFPRASTCLTIEATY